VGHNSIGGGQDNVSELTTGKKVYNPLLDLATLDVEPRGDNTALVDPASKLNNDLSRPVVIDNLKFPNVSGAEKKERENCFWC